MFEATLSIRSSNLSALNDHTITRIMLARLAEEEAKLLAAYSVFIESKALVDALSESVERHRKALECLGIDPPVG